MKTIRTLALPASIFALAVAMALHALTPAMASEGGSQPAVCKAFNPLNKAPKRQDFMDSQVHSGRTQFVAMPHFDGPTYLCAW